ncbi:MAG: pyridoxamine 5'-phosphate oxidase family protein [Methanomassiliicoccaceae archaeon]|jgi:uncharacterized pyridoxamine 5'-phosphate oxidase family protein|nr:pyridoxamine 5'-phosphate oxidase family protein [Methanomassiliicoccaceae archaeon]
MKEVISLLKENRVMHLATASSDGKPRSSIMEYGMVGDSLIFATHHGSIKDMNISENPRVSLTVGASPTYAAIDGTATPAGADEIEGLNKILFERHLLGIRHQIYSGRYTNPHEKYLDFKDMLRSGDMNMMYYKVIFDTAYYTHGLSPAKIIKMR